MGYKTINSKNIDTIVQQWEDFISNQAQSGATYTEEDVYDEFESYVDDFCDEYGHSEKVNDLMYEEPWCLQTIDSYYKLLEGRGIEIDYGDETLGK